MDAVPVAWLEPMPKTASRQANLKYLARFGKSFFTKQIQRNENDKSPMCNEKTMKMQARYKVRVHC